MNSAVLEDEIVSLFSQSFAITYQLLCRIADFDESEEWSRQGFVSCAHWLNFRVGLDLGAAREKVRTARALSALPEVSASLSRGEISYSKVRALSRIATADNERDLLEVAKLATASQVEKLTRAWARSAQSEDDRAEQATKRSCQIFFAEDGMCVLSARRCISRCSAAMACNCPTWT